MENAALCSQLGAVGYIFKKIIFKKISMYYFKAVYMYKLHNIPAGASAILTKCKKDRDDLHKCK